MRQFYDAVIVGGGPAGASCAIWLARLGLAPLLVEAGERLGGLGNDNPFTDDWIAVLPDVTGQQVAANIAASVAAAGVPVRLRAPATAVRPCKGGVEVRLGGAGQDAVYGKSLVIASGVRARGLPGHPQQARWPGVLIGPGSPIVAQDYAGLTVAVLGGGDNAFENFVYVRNRGARQVDLYARTVRAQQQWVARAGTEGVRVGPYRVDPAARTVDGRAYDLILVLWLGAAGRFCRQPGPGTRFAGLPAYRFRHGPDQPARRLRDWRGGRPHASLRGHLAGRRRDGGQGDPAPLGASGAAALSQAAASTQSSGAGAARRT